MCSELHHWPSPSLDVPDFLFDFYLVTPWKYVVSSSVIHLLAFVNALRFFHWWWSVWQGKFVDFSCELLLTAFFHENWSMFVSIFW